MVKAKTCPRFAFAFAVLIAFPAIAAATNTSECVGMMQSVSICFAGSIPGPDCCGAITSFRRSGCFCNPSVELLFGTSSVAAFPALRDQIQPACAMMAGTTFVPDDCTDPKFHTSEFGCQVPDTVIESARFGSALGFSSVFEMNKDMCFDLQGVVRSMLPFVEENASIAVPYGVGVYTGVRRDFSEYVSISLANLNLNLWSFSIDPTKSGMNIAPQVPFSSIIAGFSSLHGQLLDGSVPYQDQAQVLAYVFGDGIPASEYTRCSTKINNIQIQPSKGLATIFSYLVLGSKLFDKWGAVGICRTHTKYCTGPFAQFQNESECLSFMTSRPEFSAACGPNRPLGGDSINCRMKHMFMVPLDPELHCPHFHPPDAHHHKCNDLFECPQTDFLTPPGSPPINYSLPEETTTVAAAAALSNANMSSWPEPDICPLWCLPWCKPGPMAQCRLESSWEQLISMGAGKFITGGLGRKGTPTVNTWVCVPDHACAPPGDLFCFAYDKVSKMFYPMGSSSQNAETCSKGMNIKKD